MEIQKVTDGELNVLNVLWDDGKQQASDIVKKLSEIKGWNRNTTYTFINRLVDKGIVKRTEPNFICEALFTKEQVTLSETKSFIKRMYNGSINLMIANFLDNEDLSENELEEIKKIINKKGGQKK